MTLHDDELTIDEGLVHGLLARDYPDGAGLPLSRLPASGSTNALFRLGDDLLVRLPRQPGGGDTILKEARWAPRLAPALPVAVPDVVTVGAPSQRYPERWSVVRWLDGVVPEVVAAEADTPARPGLAHDLAAVVVALQETAVAQDALADRDLRWYRGEPLAGMAETVTAALAACRDLPGLGLDLDAATAAWDRTLALPGASRVHAPRWLHADLVTENLLVDGDRLVAVLDLGALTVGDPAVDLGVAWELLGPTDREAFRVATGASEEDWLLGRGWALALALNTFPYYWRSMPERCRARLVAARAVLADVP